MQNTDFIMPYYQVGVGTIPVPAGKNAAFKNNPKNILHDENQLYGIVIVDLTQNIIIKKKTENGQIYISF